MDFEQDIFAVRRFGDCWEACVVWDYWRLRPQDRSCRKTTTAESARFLLQCLQRELAHRPGHAVVTVEAWQRCKLCKEIADVS